MKRPRVAFVSIGQSPRDDIMPGMLSEIGASVEAVEIGLLDGMTADEIAALVPGTTEYPFVARMRDGSQSVLSRMLVEDRLERLLLEVDGRGFDAIVVLCTGTRIPCLKHTPMIEAQRVVDANVAALAANFRQLGVVVPLAKQAQSLHLAYEVNVPIKAAHASPYTRDRFSQAGRDLAECDLIVMHCMGYTADMQAEVAAHVAAPVVLANQLLSSTLRCLFGSARNHSA